MHFIIFSNSTHCKSKQHGLVNLRDSNKYKYF